MSKTLTYISAVLTVVSLILTILAYYGFTRYCRLRYGKNCECVTESYLKLPRVDSKSKVVVSMYTKSTDISNNITLKSILDQTVHPDQIIIVAGKDTDIPVFLKKDSVVVKQADENMGMASAFIRPLQTQKNADTKIIIVTDGVVYGTDFIETIVEESDRHPESVIFLEGYSSKTYVNGRVDKSYTDIINVPAGVLVRPSFFKSYIDVEKSDLLKTSPNAVFSALVAKNKVPRKIISYKETFHSSPKYNENEKSAVEYLAEYFKL